MLTGIFFMLNGAGSFVLPVFDNVAYASIEVGDHFGLYDIMGSAEQMEVNVENWYVNKKLLQVQFTT